MRNVLTLLLCVGLAVGAASCACSCPEPDPEAKARQAAALEKSWVGFQTIAKDVPKGSEAKLEECDDRALRKTRKKMKKSKLWAKAIDYDFLVDMGDEKLAKVPKGWEFLTWDTAEQLAKLKAGKPAGKREGDIRYWLGHDESRYLVVFRADGKDSKKLPKLTDKPDSFLSKKATAVAGEHFEPGIWEGWMFVYDRDTDERICQAPLKVKSRSSVTFKTRGAFQKSAKDAIRDQFKDHFKSRTKEALEAMTGELDLSMY